MKVLIINRYKTLFNKWLFYPLLGYLKRGISPKELSLAIVLGLIIGIIPVPGTSTILCILVSLLFRINLAFIQMVNYFVYPLQLILLIPFLKSGAFILNKKNTNFLLENFSGLLENSLFETFKVLWDVVLGGVVIWLLITPILGIIVFRIILFLLKKLE